MVRLRNLLIRTLAPAVACAVVISACGSQPQPATTPSKSAKAAAHDKHTVWIYSSLPSRGPERFQSQQIQDGIQLALESTGYRVGSFQIHYKALSDSPKVVKARRRGGPAVPSTGNRVAGGGAGAGTGSGGAVASGGAKGSGVSESSWSASVTVGNAEQAARNQRTVAYIGDLNSGATEVSLPILNQAGIVQITPGSGYPGLTEAYKGVTEPNTEPGKYYPQSPRSLLRLIPSDIVQAAAALRLLHSGGCQTFSAWAFGDSPETGALLNAVVKTAQTVPEYALKYDPPPKLDTKNYVGYVGLLQSAGIHCAVLVGHLTQQASVLTLALREHLTPPPTIVGTSGFCNAGWAQSIPKAYRKTVLTGLYCTTPARPITGYPGTKGPKGFIATFHRAYRRRPTVYAFFGYESARMVMRGLQEVGSGEDTRQQVLGSLAEDIALAGPAAYSFASDADELSRAYGIDYFPGGILRPYRTVTPSYLLTSTG